MLKVEIRSRKVIVELEREGKAESWLTMDETGQIRNFPTPQGVVRWIKTRDRAAAARGVSTATMVEWRNVPDGFTPPEAY